MLALPPARLGELSDPVDGEARVLETLRFTGQFNVSGQPAASLPLHWTTDGLPIGVQLVADYGREDVLFRVASQLEAGQPLGGPPPARARLRRLRRPSRQGAFPLRGQW